MLNMTLDECAGVLSDPIPNWNFDVFVNPDEKEIQGLRDFRICVTKVVVKGNKFRVTLLVTNRPHTLPKIGDKIDVVMYPNDPSPKDARVISFVIDSEADLDVDLDANLSRFGMNTAMDLNLTYKIKDKKVGIKPLSVYMKPKEA